MEDGKTYYCLLESSDGKLVYRRLDSRMARAGAFFYEGEIRWSVISVDETTKE